MADGFLGRWSRRKLDAKEGRPLAPEPPAPAPAAAPATAATSSTPPVRPAQGTDAPAAGPAVPAASQAPAAPAEPPPTLADVQALTPESDFARFTGPQVAPEVRNAAMKKLFSDPHFNVMDGLDIYIEDYGKPDPLPAGMLRGLASAEFLGLFPKDRTNAAKTGAPGAPSAQDAPQFVAQSEPPEPDPTRASDRDPDADPDLRLQQDPAPGPQGPGEGAG